MVWQDEGPHAVRRPIVVVGAEVGNLDRHIGGAGQRAHAGAPGRDGVVVAVGGAAGVVEDDVRIGEGAGEVERIPELAGIDHHVEGEAETPQQAEAAPPGGIPHQVGALVEGPGGVPVPAQNLADAAHVALRAVRFQHRAGVRLLEAGVSHDPVGEAMLVGDGLQPACLGGRVVPQKTRLDVDRLHQVDAGHVGPVVGEQVVADERRRAAEHHLARAVGQPRVTARVQLPEMMVGIDDRPVIEAGHGLLPSCLPRALPGSAMAAHGCLRVKTPLSLPAAGA